jgi:hypothetical protein
MNAEPLLKRIAAALHKCKLEAVMIGNAAAALQGAPVTTVDFDFMFRDTPRNLEKLKLLARELDLPLIQPAVPFSAFWRLGDEKKGLQVDFLGVVTGVQSFASLRSRASEARFGEHTLLIADMRDIIKSKKAAKRSSDLAVMGELERTLREKKGIEKKNH